MASRYQRDLGLRQVAPIGGTIDNTTIDIIAVHGLETGSPQTWEYRKKGRGRGVNRISDSDMLPAAIPQARIYTYDWDANCFQDSPVQTLLGHADNLLALVSGEQASQHRQIIFVASCFGGLILAEAICRAAQEGSRYRHVLLSTIGAVFLATPFCGSDAAAQAQWLVIVKGIIGEQSSDQLVRDLEKRHNFVCQRVQKFTEVANADSIRLPLHCFFETKKTELLRNLLPHSLAASLTFRSTHKIEIACYRVFRLPTWDSSSSWLLVVDNADDTQLLFGDNGLYNYLPFSSKGSILFTTRNHAITEGLLDVPRQNTITVKEMSRAEAIEMLQGNLTESQVQDAISTESLLDFLADLPLAIKQASAFMAKTGMSTARYLSHVQSSNMEFIKLLSKDFEDPRCYKAILNPVATTWLISFDQISRDNQLAICCLKFMCFVAEKNIPQSLLPVRDDLEMIEATSMLKAYAFITEQEEQASYDIHRLVPIVIRNWLETKGLLEDSVTSVIQQLRLKFPFQKHESRDMWMKYLPHALAALKFQSYCTDGKAQGNFLDIVGNCLLLLGKYQAAEQMFRQALQVQETVLEKDDPDTLKSMSNLASMLDSQGNYEESEAMNGQVLQLSQKALGPKHPETLISMSNLALVLSRQGKYKDSEAMNRQVLQLSQKVLGPKHPETLIIMSNLAAVLDMQGNYEESEAMNRQVLQLSQKALGPEHPETLTSMSNLASALDSQGKYHESLIFYNQACLGYEMVLGEHHPYTIECKNDRLSLLGRIDAD